MYEEKFKRKNDNLCRHHIYEEAIKSGFDVVMTVASPYSVAAMYSRNLSSLARGVRPGSLPDHLNSRLGIYHIL